MVVFPQKSIDFFHYEYDPNEENRRGESIDSCGYTTISIDIF